MGFIGVAAFTYSPENPKEFSNHVQPQFTLHSEMSDWLFQNLKTRKIRFDQRDCLGINPYGH